VHPQLTLPIATAPNTSFATFHSGAANQLAADGIKAFAARQLDADQLYVWGESGAGKSHLLSAACHLANEAGHRVAYIPGSYLNQTHALIGLEQSDLVCIDDLQQLQGAGEEDLFHCINRCRAASTHLIFAADRAPEQLMVSLPDLATRLTWGPVFHLGLLSESELAAAVRHLFEIRALGINDEVLIWLLRHQTRSMPALVDLVQRLDKASLATQRRITIPLVRSVLGLTDTEHNTADV